MKILKKSLSFRAPSRTSSQISELYSCSLRLLYKKLYGIIVLGSGGKRRKNVWCFHRGTILDTDREDGKLVENRGRNEMGHKKGRSKAETIEVKIERRCSSKEHGDYRKQLRGERLNGDSGDAFSPWELLADRRVASCLQIVARLNIVTHTRAHVARSIDKWTTAEDEYVYTAERSSLFEVFIEARIHDRRQYLFRVLNSEFYFPLFLLWFTYHSISSFDIHWQETQVF